MLANLYSNPGARMQIIEELIKFAHKELLYKYAENVMQNYFGYILFTLSSGKENIPKNDVTVPFPTEDFKQLVEFVNTHICLKTLLEIIMGLLETQNICLQFGQVPKVYFNEDLVSDIYEVLMSVFKHVLKKNVVAESEKMDTLWILSVNSFGLGQGKI